MEKKQASHIVTAFSKRLSALGFFIILRVFLPPPPPLLLLLFCFLLLILLLLLLLPRPLLLLLIILLLLLLLLIILLLLLLVLLLILLLFLLLLLSLHGRCPRLCASFCSRSPSSCYPGLTRLEPRRGRRIYGLPPLPATRRGIV